MLMDNSYQIWEACSKDDMRPSLTCVNFVKAEDVGVTVSHMHNGVAVATDGFVLAVVPVQLDEEDVPGMVLGETVKQAWRESKKYKAIYDGTFMRLNEHDVGLPIEIQMPRRMQDYGTYPDFTSIVPKEIPTVNPDKLRSTIALDAALLLRLGKALGIPPAANKESLIKIHFNGSKASPYWVEPSTKSGSDITAPFGLLMPIHYYGSDEDE